MSRVRVPEGVPDMARWSSGLRLRPLTPATRVRISYGSPLWATKEKKIVGVYSDEGPPVPIPNTAVKLISAENTWGAAPWEDRATPTFLYASIAQSVEHAAVNRGVTGSSPVWGATEKGLPEGSPFFRGAQTGLSLMSLRQPRAHACC